MLRADESVPLRVRAPDAEDCLLSRTDFCQEVFHFRARALADFHQAFERQYEFLRRLLRLGHRCTNLGQFLEHVPGTGPGPCDVFQIFLSGKQLMLDSAGDGARDGFDLVDSFPNSADTLDRVALGRSLPRRMARCENGICCDWPVADGASGFHHVLHMRLNRPGGSTVHFFR